MQLIGLELLATTLADKDMANVLPNIVLVRRWQRPESLVTDITGVNPLSLSSALYFVLHHLLMAVKPQVTLLLGNVSPSPALIPSSYDMNSPTNPPLTPAGSGASR